MKLVKKFTGLIIAFAMILSVAFGTNTTANVKTLAADTKEQVSSVSYWSGVAADEFASGSGSQSDPYIIETADQLYKMVLSSGTLTDGSAAYYKVADGVTAFYLNDADTLDEIKALVNNNNYKNWKATQTFYGIFNGNGVTVYGMVSYKANAFVYALDGNDATIRNIAFDSCYVYSTGNASIVTTRTGNYLDEVQDLPVIANVSVKNVYVETTRNISVNDSGNHAPSAAGLVSTNDTCKKLTISNCFFDGYSSELVQGSASTADATAGIFSGSNSANNVTVNSCVSLGAQVFPQAVGGKYTRYDINNNSGYQVFAYNTYCDLDETVKETAVIKIDKKAKYHIKDLYGLNWISDWQLVDTTIGLDDFDGSILRTIPMPKSNSGNYYTNATYSAMLSEQINGAGASSVIGGPYYSGEYGMYYKLLGSGTESDPYLINNAFELARAIASGGVNVYNRLYYKLTTDIDASGASWITQDSLGSKYKYVAFNGVLDGDGHTVSGIYAGDDQSIGLIPILAENGVVKNIHVRNSSFISINEYAGAVVGKAYTGAVVEGCSAEDNLIISKGSDLHIVGNNQDATIKNCYYIAGEDSTAQISEAYYNENGTVGDIDVDQNSDVWYIGGPDGCTPRLKNYVATRELADVDGDGITEEYTSRDIVSLRKKLLLVPEYQNIYGDIDRNGEVDISDITLLCRQIIDDYYEINDGLWRNIELGRISIYYGENDNYDAARRLELYIEQQLPQNDIQKVVSAQKIVSGTDSDSSAVYLHSNDQIGTPDGQLEIIVGNIDNCDDYINNSYSVNEYSITYDEENCVLWLNGGSFTAVEQAVLDFINNSGYKTNNVYTVESATLSAEKQAKTVMVDTDYDGVADTEKEMYYAWGDEFNGIKDVADGENAEISLDTWINNRMNSETLKGKAGNYNNVEAANEKEMSKLYWVEDGKLSITRGVVADYATDVTDKLGYVRLYNQTGTTAFSDTIDEEDIIANAGSIKTHASMLYKQGYAEMYGSLPSDGHTFASWWMLGHGAGSNRHYSELLYSKVYKLNNVGEYAYNGTSSTPISTDPTTYKYQIPTTYFEIDVWELMQNNGIASSSVQKVKTTGFYDYRLYLNVHKFYSVGSNNAQIVNVIDWDNPGTPIKVMEKDWFGKKEGDYYFSTSATWHDFTDGTNTRFTKTGNVVTANYVEELQRQLTAPRRYGFYWSTNGTDKFNFTLYIYDVNGDGVEGDDMILGTSDMTYNVQDKMDPQDYDVINDAETANQYMYFLFDNILYTSNPNHQDATAENAVMHTDMLTDEGTAENPDKIDLEIDYIRVYQFDGKRDVVTRLTEEFNNGNHFGY